MSGHDLFGNRYRDYRRPDPRIAARITAALGPARRVLNVGAGTGSYEPGDRDVVALEPSARMIAHRPPASAPAVQGAAEAMPFPDGTFDAAMAVLTIQHWSDLEAGLAEMRRVADRQVIFTFDVTRQRELWFTAEYVPAAADFEEARAPRLDQVVAALDGATIEDVPIPADCVDGFGAAYWRRPGAYLDPEVRANISSLLVLAPDQVEPGVSRLAEDLRTGRWERRHRDLLDLDALELGYHLVVAGKRD